MFARFKSPIALRWDFWNEQNLWRSVNLVTIAYYDDIFKA